MKKGIKPGNGVVPDPDMVRDLRKEAEHVMPSRRRGGRSTWDLAAHAFGIEGRPFGERPK